MLEELAKRDKEWRRMALSICNDKDLADELVQDMYIKIHDMGKKEVNGFYVYYTMKHLFYDRFKKTKEIPVDVEFEVIIADAKLNGNWINTNHEDHVLRIREEINDCLNELSFKDREILLNTHERSFRKNEELLGLSATSLWFWSKEALEELKKIYDERNKE